MYKITPNDEKILSDCRAKLVAEWYDCPYCGKKECYELVDITIRVEGGYIRSFHCHECLRENQEIEDGP